MTTNSIFKPGDLVVASSMTSNIPGPDRSWGVGLVLHQNDEAHFGIVEALWSGPDGTPGIYQRFPIWLRHVEDK